MIRRILPSLLLVICLITTAAGQDGDTKLVSGPQEGTELPGPCAVFNINGKHKSQFHCLVCEYGADPVLMIFAQEPKAGEDGVFSALVRRLEETAGQNQDVSFRAFVVILSPDFRGSVTADAAKDTDKIADEVLTRTKLLSRLEDRASKLKHVTLACTTAEGPKTYTLNPKAEVTVVFYQKLKVIKNYTYGPGKMMQEDVDSILEKVEKTLKEGKKRPVKK